MIGNARLQLWAWSRARFSILIGEAAHRGSGQGTEATALVCRYAFERLDLREIVLDVDPRNAAAVRAYLTVGFVPGRGDSMRLRPEGLRYTTAAARRGARSARRRAAAGPTYSELGRIRRLSACCSITCAAQPTTRLIAKIGVKSPVSMPR